MKKLLLLIVSLTLLGSYACQSGDKPEVLTPSPVPSATLPVPLPTARLLGRSEYDQVRDEEPCARGSVGEGYIWVAAEFVLLCTRTTGDLTVVINPTGNLAAYRAVKKEVVDPSLCRLLSPERRRWLFWAAVDLKTFESEATTADGTVTCND